MLIDCGKHVFWKADKAIEVKCLWGADKVDTPTIALKHDDEQKWLLHIVGWFFFFLNMFYSVNIDKSVRHLLRALSAFG